MPMYEYLCLECGHRYSELEKYETKNQKCPECGRDTAKRVLGAPAIKFVGSGWPSNDAKTIIGAK